MQFDDLHKEIIQDHYRKPRMKKSLTPEQQAAVLDNPSCGDRVALSIVWEGEQIKSLYFDGEGCSISMASASMLSELLQGKTKTEALAISSEIHSIFRGEEPVENLEQYGDIQAFQGLIQYPVRLKCAVLAWQTLDLLLKDDHS